MQCKMLKSAGTFAQRLLVRPIYSAIQQIRPLRMDAKLDAVPLVDIDAEGRFKYILIKVFAPSAEDSSNGEPSKLIVRGFQRAKWHQDIYDEVSPGILAQGLAAKCLGGGRIEHFPDAKKLKVYGLSTGFGPADHAESRKVLLTKYTDYTIDISDAEE